MNKNELRLKCENCINFALKLVEQLRLPINEKQCVLVVPPGVFTLVKKNRHYIKAPSATLAKVVPCGAHLKS